MCGLAGSVNFALDIPRVTKDLWHRGPDEQSTYKDSNLILHHHRLSILDISGGKQPMHFEHLTVIFNGEIYNHREVRKKLKLTCHTASDTETILQAYYKLKEKCLDEFDGMFVIVIYDRISKSLFIARDRAGKKPLYYYTKGQQFVFASELNTLNNQVRPQVNSDNISQFLHYGAFHHEATPYQDIFELPPGHFAWVSTETGSVKVQDWWSIETFYKNKVAAGKDEALNRVDELLHKAIKRRIESSDLEVGSFLSGGIDSGLVTAIASEYNSKLKTFTVSFSGTYDEAPLAKLVAQKYHTDHTEIKINFNDLQFDIEKILANYGEPFYDDSAIPSYYVSREARKHLTVILNGDGSDELFGGYRRYVPFAKYDFFSRSVLSASFARVMKKLIPVQHNKQSKLNYLYRLSDLASQKGSQIYFSATTDIFTGYNQFLLPSADNKLENFDKKLESLKNEDLSGLQKIMLMDFNAILPDILLVKMDIATMAHSLEGRSPFLSKEILQYAPGLPDKYKIRGSTTKYLLRQLAAKYLPAELVDQPKRGFEVPLKEWVDKQLREIIFSHLDTSSSYSNNFVDRKFIQRLLERKLKVSDEKRAKMLYTLFALNVWYSKCATNADRSK
jgi:asparagine synthase (glutamine-hydrolysing)